MKLYYLATVCCDDGDESRVCTETVSYREAIGVSPPRTFAAEARSYFRSLGWHCRNGTWRCPAHSFEDKAC